MDDAERGRRIERRRQVVHLVKAMRANDQIAIDNLMKGARNPRILNNQPGNVDMSNGVELKEVPTGKIDRSMGDVHAYGNPHYTLNPQIAQRMAATLVKAMINADPKNADF